MSAGEPTVIAVTLERTHTKRVEELREAGRLRPSRKLCLRAGEVGKWGWGSEYFDEALLNLIDVASNAIVRVKREGACVAMNLTGGFKPESSFLYVLASLYDVELVYYIHGTFRRVVTLPVLRLSIDPALATKILDAFKHRTIVPARELPIELRVRGVVRERGEAESYTLRPWVKRLLEDLSKRGREA